MKNKFQYALLAWSEFGQSPQELFLDETHIKKLGNYDIKKFTNDLNVKLNITCPLYRYMTLHKTCAINDIIEFTHPTSWTSDFQVASDMAEGTVNADFLILDCENIFGVFNHKNQYAEEEYILTPMKLKVTGVAQNRYNVRTCFD